MACAAMISAASTATFSSSGAAVKLPSHKDLALVTPLAKKQVSVAISNGSRVSMSLPAKENHSVVNLTGLALIAAAVVPEMAEAAQPGVSDSLRNLLLSVLAGGVVISAIGVAVAGVSTFDPVSRR